MLTSYVVKCPHVGCGWLGSLLPSGDPEPWRGPSPGALVVAFQCPQCHEEWHARVVGDDVEALPVENVASPLM